MYVPLVAIEVQHGLTTCKVCYIYNLLLNCNYFYTDVANLHDVVYVSMDYYIQVFLQWFLM